MIEKNNYENERLHYIDAIKGVAIILVLIGHRSINSYVMQFIYLFHMPLFFLVSGYLDKMEEGTIGKSIRKRAGKLLYPYVIFGILIVIYNTLFDALRGATEKGRLTKRIIALFYGNYIWENNSDYIGTLWFLVGLFFTAIIANCIYYLAHKNIIKVLIWSSALMFLGGMCSYMNSKNGFRLPWCTDVAFIATLFYLLGFYWKHWKPREKYETLPIGISSFVLGMGLGIVNLLYMRLRNLEMLRVDMLNMNYGILPLFYISAALMSLGLMILFKRLYIGRRLKRIERIGQLSLLIMIVHLYVYQIFNLILNRLGCNYWIVFFSICLVTSIGIAEIIDRFFPFLFNYKKIFLGRKRQ